MNFQLVVKIHALSLITGDSSLVDAVAPSLPTSKEVKKKEKMRDVGRVWAWWKGTDRSKVGDQENVNRLILEIDEGIDSLLMEYKC